eukprot:g35358.t1
MLWDCLESVDWTLFKNNLDEYSTIVMDFISKSNASSPMTPALTYLDAPIPSVTTANVRSVFLRVNPSKVTVLDGDPSCVLRSYVGQLVEVFIDIFNLSLLQASILTCFKKTTIIPVPKKAHAMCFNDYCPGALTSTIM